MVSFYAGIPKKIHGAQDEVWETQGRCTDKTQVPRWEQGTARRGIRTNIIVCIFDNMMKTNKITGVPHSQAVELT